MSADTNTAKKRTSATSSKRTSEEDHRRKRRNRPTQSCLNCHTSKRMCDRQRPCGRCTQLGLTGLCVYEVDNPTHKANAQDETGRLKKRVAELESIIRELKNKPHPRWAQPGQSSPETEDSVPSNHELGRAGSSTMAASRRPLSPPTSPSAEPNASPASSPTLLVTQCFSSSPARGSSPMYPPSPTLQSQDDTRISSDSDITSLLNTPDYDLSSLLASYSFPNGPGIDEAFFGDILDPILPVAPDACGNHRSDEHCGCLNEHASYQTVLELSLRLRRATEILSRYAKHTSGSDCRVHKGISELDRFTTTALGNIVTPPEPVTPQSHAQTTSLATSTSLGRPSYAGARSSLGVPSASLSSQGIHSPRAWDFRQAQSASYPSPPWEDSFMSWESLRHQNERSKGSPF
ncbi:hypothetical protein DICSQDRAFT_79541 [Dichomitus squalens LYAD-421 SS1]|uniref:uncharacterized protein n=1 Tax=Dichomitus squalens (strain LYAD-421) TaxID=732165 RepID=UPI00044146B9|nr:uncharacterized protein DICSQDRAFT_79541 [Dichomitus squalens LYAD-421 SS1]EJF65404.1 hypothetical protein DICSQDRAFT_79541 [Dichomitus squalens LYAD-421 SS1]